MWPILLIAWVLFGLIVLWFTYNWMVEKHGKRAFHGKLEFGDALPLIFACIFTIVSSGLAWPLMLGCFLVAGGGAKGMGKPHPIRAVNKPMKYIVKEIQNPRKNVNGN